jgi:NTE family protein
MDRLFKIGKKKTLAFVLGGGGSRGAYQVGALQALLEAGIQPDLLVGCSIGSANGAFIAVHGYTAAGIQKLKETWAEAAREDLLPTNYLLHSVRGLFHSKPSDSSSRFRAFLVKHGLGAELRFGDLAGPRLVTISTDINTGGIEYHGLDPHERVVEAVLASSALPPWMTPVVRDHSSLIDGGFLSTLPVEPAMTVGATEMIAIDLCNCATFPTDAHGIGGFIEKVITATEMRQAEMELALAAARKIPVLHLRMDSPQFVQPWDFQYTQELIGLGYAQTKEKVREYN